MGERQTAVADRTEGKNVEPAREDGMSPLQKEGYAQDKRSESPKKTEPPRDGKLEMTDPYKTTAKSGELYQGPGEDRYDFDVTSVTNGRNGPTRVGCRWKDGSSGHKDLTKNITERRRPDGTKEVWDDKGNSYKQNKDGSVEACFADGIKARFTKLKGGDIQVELGTGEKRVYTQEQLEKALKPPSQQDTSKTKDRPSKTSNEVKSGSYQDSSSQTAESESKSIVSSLGEAFDALYRLIRLPYDGIKKTEEALSRQ